MYLSQKACVGGTGVEKLIFKIISVKDEATHLQQWLGVSHLLERHPFSGLVHSAGELLHTSEYRPAVKMNQHPLWYMMSEQLSTLTQR